MRYKFILPVILSVLIGGVAYADIVSPDHTFVGNDVYTPDFHTRLNRDITQLTNGINNIDQTQVKDDTLDEATMGDAINPRVRTYEGASCEFVYSGLLPAVNTGSYTTYMDAGTAYPRGYRCNKSGTTAHTFTSGVYTYVDINQACDFQYTESAWASAEPANALNSIRIARVSADNGGVKAVVDKRTTSCATGTFSGVKSSSTGSSLADILENGQQVRNYSNAGPTPQGYAQGLFVSYDTQTTFKVTPGAAEINTQYRHSTANITVPTSVDDPVNGISGIASGTIAASTKYYVYAVAEQSSVNTMSITFSTNSSYPSGITNYRLIGSIRTDAAAHFTSWDTVTAHAVTDRDLITTWGQLDYHGVIKEAFNVSAVADSGIGLFQVTFDHDYNSTDYAFICTTREDSDNYAAWCCLDKDTTPTPGALTIEISTDAAAEYDTDYTMFIVTGDMRQ